MHLHNIISSVLKNKGGAFFYTPPFYNGGMSFIFNRPSVELTANTIEEINKVLNKAENLRKEYTGYCLISYEAGYLMEKSLHNLYKPAKGAIPLVKFFFFEKNSFSKISSEEIEIEYSGFNNYSIKSFQLNTSESEYIENINLIKNCIYEGDTYQVNYTVKGKFTFEGDVEALFAQMVFNQTARYISLVNSGSKLFCSLSPELFFEVEGNKITTKPMKGTIRRGINGEVDKWKYEELRESKKDKSENVMVVDLLRNDIGRICKFNTVNVPSLYSIEKYESLYQMTSVVEGELVDGTAFKDIIKNIFPCGSITGAPKISTMKIIDSVEKEQRGIYTGTIGLLEPDKTVCNVAIRTLCIDSKTGEGEIGVGSGIVADSIPKREYEECLLKCNFLLKPLDYFELFETMRVERCGVFLLREHLERLKEAASHFLFIYDEFKIVTRLKKVLSKLDRKQIYKVKLLLSKSGNCNFEVVYYFSNPLGKKITISPKNISTINRFQYFKTTNRRLYSSEYEKNKERFTDVIFFNEKGELAEGSISNIIVKQNDEWFTPPVSSGILNGVYRAYMLKNNLVKEKVLYEDDLLNSAEIKLINSVRKEMTVVQVYQKDICVHELNHDNILRY